MTSEVVYYCSPEGAGTALQVLEHLHSKTLARSLAFIDLLEQTDLPKELDRAVGGKAGASDERAQGQPDGDRGGKTERPIAALRTLNAYAGRTKLRIAYSRIGERVVILGAGHHARGAELAKLVQEFEHSAAPKSKGKSAKEMKSGFGLKSHREFVAELTLSDPVLAAHYSKARERAQFALSLIRLRDRAKFTNATLAERTGLSLSRIRSLTRGRLPKLDTMRRLADALQARIIIAPGGGITLEAAEAVEQPVKQTAPQKPRNANANGHGHQMDAPSPTLILSESGI